MTEATIAGRRVRLLLQCESYGDFASLLEALRQAVENEDADIVVLSNNTDEGPVVKAYAKEHPKITFSMTSGEQTTTLDDPAPNLFRFVGDNAQASAGLGAYAYRTLHWRSAVTVSDGTPDGWSKVAGFVAEFCSLGGKIVRRRWLGLDSNFAGVVKKIPPRGVDGVVFPSELVPAGPFMNALANRYPRWRFRDRLLVNAATLHDPKYPLTHRMLGLVGVSNEPLTAIAGSRRFPSQTDFYAYDAMEPVLETLQRVDGDLSHGERRFQRALAHLTFRGPNGTTTLDARHQAIAPTYLERVERNSHGKLVVRQFAVVSNVDQTFGGYFRAGAPPPGRKQPECERGNLPAWVSSVPTTR